MDVMARRRAIMAHIARLVKKIISSVTGLVSFVTNVVMPTKVVCEFSPVQEGTGDPSPDNVRPISGWTGCEIGHTRKNLFDGTVTNARIQNGVVVATGSYRLSEYIRVNPDTSYALVDKDGNLSQIFAHFFDENKTFLQSITTTEGIVVSPAGASYMRFHVTSRTFADQKPFMLFEGSTATAYEPYQGATLSITFTDPSTGDPMTIYGGTVTLNEDGSADLVATWGRVDAANMTFARFSSNYEDRDNNIYGPVLNIGVVFKSTVNPTNAPAYSNVAKAAYGKTGKIFAISGQLFLSIYSPTTLSTGSEVLAYLSSIGFYVVGMLITPQTYHFDSIGQLQSFLGTNNIWHNMNGDITVEYWNKQ